MNSKKRPPIDKVIIKALLLGTISIGLLECYYVVTIPGITLSAIIVDVFLSIGIMLAVAFFFVREHNRVIGTLREGEEKYRRLLRDINDGYFVIQDEKIIIANQRAADVLGLTIDQIVGTRLGDLTVGGSRDQGPASESPALPSTLDRYRKRIKGELPQTERYEISQGTGRTYEYSVKLIDYEGHPAVATVIRDITERKRMEETLRESEERLRLIFEFAPDAYYLSDLQGNFVDGNSAAEEVTGYTRAELIGKSFLELQLLSSEQLPKAAALLAKNLDGQPTGPDEFTFCQKDGDQVVLEIRTHPVTIHGQALVLGIAHDITERKRVEETLRESEEKYRLLAENVSDLIWTMGWNNRRFTYMSPSVMRLSGYSVEEVMAKTIEETLTPASLQALRKALAETLAMKDVRKMAEYWSRPVESELYCKDGSTVWVETKIALLPGADGRTVGILGVTRDISERKRAEEQLKESERLYSTMAHSSQVGVYIIQDGKFVFANPQFQKDSGYAEDELLGREALGLVHPEDKELVRENAVKMLKGELSSPYEFRVLDKDGTTKWIMESVASIQHLGKQATLGNFMDITARKQMEETIRHMAYHDALTDLPNRILLDDRLNVELAHACRNKQKLALLFLDLDRLKEVNDTFGHKAGDQTLRAVGQRLTSLLRKSDTVARMGGDEFTIILPEIARPNDADKVAQKILEVLREPFTLDGLKVRITTSIGIAIYPDDGEDADTLVKNADNAMYSAKQQGGDRHLCHTPAMNAEAHYREHPKPLHIGGAQGES